MDGAVTVFGKLLQDVTDASLGPDARVPGNPQSLRQGIGGLEANAVDIERQPIRILLDAGNSLVAVGLVDTDGSGSANAMGVEEDYNLPDHFLGLPRFDDALFAFGANAVKFGQAFGGLRNDVKDLRAKGLDQLFGKVRADAFDHAGAEIFFNTFEGTRRDDAQRLRLELQAMRPIVDPHTLPLNVLPRVNRCRGADDRHQIAVPTDLDPEDAEAGLLTMEGHTLHGTGQLFG